MLQAPTVGDRLSLVYLSLLEESVQKFLESLEELTRYYLTRVEDKLLNVLESEYDQEITP